MVFACPHLGCIGNNANIDSYICISWGWELNQWENMEKNQEKKYIKSKYLDP